MYHALQFQKCDLEQASRPHGIRYTGSKGSPFFGFWENHKLLISKGLFSPPNEIKELKMKRPNPQAIRLKRHELAELDRVVELLEAKTGDSWNRHRTLRVCARTGLGALLEELSGGGDAVAPA